jgi:hypothetical protein
LLNVEEEDERRGEDGGLETLGKCCTAKAKKVGSVKAPEVGYDEWNV